MGCFHVVEFDVMISGEGQVSIQHFENNYTSVYTVYADWEETEFCASFCLMWLLPKITVILGLRLKMNFLLGSSHSYHEFTAALHLSFKL